ncbi:MAG: hypothetical protein MJ252_23040 [archaeon]|nr:hypothetical protein [archaeon]
MEQVSEVQKVTYDVKAGDEAEEVGEITDINIGKEEKQSYGENRERIMEEDIGYPGMEKGEEIQSIEVEEADFEDDMRDEHFQQRLEMGYQQRKEITQDLYQAGNYMKDQLDDIRQNRPDLIVSKEEAMQDENSEFFGLGLLSQFFSECGIDNEILREAPGIGRVEDLASQAVQEAMVNSDLLRSDNQNFKFDFGEEKNEEILQDAEAQERFIKETKEQIKQTYGFHDKDFDIIGLSKGSLDAHIAFYSYDYRTGNKGEKLSFSEVSKDPKNKGKKLPNLVGFQDSVLMKGLYLHPGMLDMKKNTLPNGWGKTGTMRGPIGYRMEYFPPIGWTGFGLKAFTSPTNTSWMRDINTRGEWWIAYHGVKVPKKTTSSAAHDIAEKGYFDHIKKAADSEDFNHPGRLCKGRVLLTPYPQVAEFFCQSSPITYKNDKYCVAFMVRVDPMAAQINDKDHSTWYCDGSKGQVRPTIVLFKKVSNPPLSAHDIAKYKENKLTINWGIKTNK